MTSSKAVFPKQDMMSPLSPGAKKVTEVCAFLYFINIFTIIYIIYYLFLQMMNHYKEKCVKLECELATMRRKWDVLSEK